jgi:hypothetical protein
VWQGRSRSSSILRCALEFKIQDLPQCFPGDEIGCELRDRRDGACGMVLYATVLYGMVAVKHGSAPISPVLLYPFLFYSILSCLHHTVLCCGVLYCLSSPLTHLEGSDLPPYSTHRHTIRVKRADAGDYRAGLSCRPPLPLCCLRVLSSSAWKIPQS